MVIRPRAAAAVYDAECEFDGVPQHGAWGCNAWVSRGDRVTLATDIKPCQSSYPFDQRVDFGSIAILPCIGGLRSTRDSTCFFAFRRLICVQNRKHTDGQP
jgi:hypothetical protein